MSITQLNQGVELAKKNEMTTKSDQKILATEKQSPSGVAPVSEAAANHQQSA
jgi:hypothetical protein